MNMQSQKEPPSRNRQGLIDRLDEALAAAQMMRQACENMFPAAMREVDARAELAGLSVDEKLALGDEAAGELTALAFQLAPEKTMDQLESQLAKDDTSKTKAASLITRVSRT